ncbi:MAG: hypothetical protein GY795_02530 [Desulfobacterales bacterium]|nr:hypothetical protein [Desulfobacterales bacterium]
MIKKAKIRICEECENYYRSRPGPIYWCKDCDTGRFVRRAKIVHGEKYDYNPSEYDNAGEKLEIRCPEHGVFMQSPSTHLRGRGCPECSGKKKLTNEIFIKRARKVHGKKYSYKEVNYVNGKTKVRIICKIHGCFEQLPSSHFLGSGCPECVGMKKLTASEFITRAVKKHGSRYDYSEVKYTNRQAAVKIICKKHGCFMQVANNHLKGRGCPECNSKKKLTKKTFVEKAIKIHGKKYSYEEVNYVNSKIKVRIICKIHGCFEQVPSFHLSGQGCPECDGKLTKKAFVEKARKVHGKTFVEKAVKTHGKKYSYEEVNYVNSKTKVRIICRIHGCFEQKPGSHLLGRGCPECGGKKN